MAVTSADSPARVGTSRRLHIERLVAGGDGMARDDDGRIVFVEGVVAGEDVDAEFVETAPAPRALAPRIGLVGRSAGKTATPPGSNPSMMDAFSWAMPSMLSKASRCAGATVVITTTSGRAIRDRGAISPGWFMPISITAKSASRGIRASVSGTPQWLL